MDLLAPSCYQKLISTQRGGMSVSNNYILSDDTSNNHDLVIPMMTFLQASRKMSKFTSPFIPNCYWLLPVPVVVTQIVLGRQPINTPLTLVAVATPPLVVPVLPWRRSEFIWKHPVSPNCYQIWSFDSRWGDRCHSCAARKHPFCNPDANSKCDM